MSLASHVASAATSTPSTTRLNVVMSTPELSVSSKDTEPPAASNCQFSSAGGSVSRVVMDLAATTAFSLGTSSATDTAKK